MGALGVAQLERIGERVEDGVRDAGRVAALEPLVVLDAHTGKRGDLLTAQAWHLATAVAAQPDRLGRDLGPPPGEELRKLVCRVHGFKARRAGEQPGCPPSTP